MIKVIYFVLLITSVIWTTVLPSFNIGPITFFPLRILTIIGLIGMIFEGKKIKLSKKDSLTIIFFFVTITKAILSITWAVDISISMTAILTYIVNFSLILILVSLVKNTNDLKVVLVTYTVNIIIVCLFGVYEIFTPDYLFASTDIIFNRISNSFGLNYPLLHFNNTNNLATFLTISIPLVLMIKSKNNKRLQLMKKIAIILMLFNIIMSDSRGSIMAVLIISVIYIMKYLKFKKINIKIQLVFIVGLVASMLPFISNMIIDILSDVRLIIWNDTLKTLMQTFFVGVGAGNSEIVNANMSHTDTGIYSVHNYFLEFFSNFGLLAFILFLLWLFTLFLRSKNSAEKLNNRIFIILFILLSVVPSTMSGMYFIWFGFAIIIIQIKLTRNLYYQYT